MAINGINHDVAEVWAGIRDIDTVFTPEFLKAAGVAALDDIAIRDRNFAESAFLAGELAQLNSQILPHLSDLTLRVSGCVQLAKIVPERGRSVPADDLASTEVETDARFVGFRVRRIQNKIVNAWNPYIGWSFNVLGEPIHDSHEFGVPVSGFGRVSVRHAAEIIPSDT